MQPCNSSQAYLQEKSHFLSCRLVFVKMFISFYPTNYPPSKQLQFLLSYYSIGNDQENTIHFELQEKVIIHFQAYLMDEFYAKTTKSACGRVYKIIEPQPFSHGYNRNAFMARIIEGPCAGQKGVVKIFIGRQLRNNQQQIQADVRVSTIAKTYATMFSNILGNERILKFRESEIVKIEKTYQNSEHFFAGDTVVVERYIMPTFTHWTSCFGDEYIQSRTLRAFEHFVYNWSNGTRMICDFQGGKSENGFYELTDPTMSSTIDEGIHLNGGGEVIRKVRARHTCNDICQRLGF